MYGIIQMAKMIGAVQESNGADMEVERKYLLGKLPEHLEQYPFHDMEQAYLCVNPVVRIRRSDDDYYMTYKSDGLMAREEYNLPLTEDAYRHLLEKADGIILKKRRYMIPLGNRLTAEIDIFSGVWEGLIITEVEFPDLVSAESFQAPDWFGDEVTYDGHYHNSWLSSHFPENLLRGGRNDD